MVGGQARHCIVYGINGLQLRSAIFPLKRLSAFQIGVAADADTAYLLGRLCVPAQNLGEGAAGLAEARRQLSAGEALFAFAPADAHDGLFASADSGTACPHLCTVEALVQAVADLGSSRALVPHLPGRPAAGPQVLEDDLVPQGVHGLPETVVAER